MQVFVKLSYFFRQITTKTGNFRQMWFCIDWYLYFWFRYSRSKLNKGKAWRIPSLKILPGDLDLWFWKSIGFQILLRTKYIVCTKFGQNPLKDVDSRVFTRHRHDKGKSICFFHIKAFYLKKCHLNCFLSPRQRSCEGS
jgi:hypothetical protein